MVELGEQRLRTAQRSARDDRRRGPTGDVIGVVTGDDRVSTFGESPMVS